MTMISSTLLLSLVGFISTCLASQSSVDLSDQLDKSDLQDASTVTALFNAWQKKHGISFKTSLDGNKAFEVLLQNARKIKQHRSEHRLGLHTYTLGLNKFSHMTSEEFKSKRLGSIKYKSGSGSNSAMNYGAFRGKRAATLPLSLNWTAQGYVTPVKDQGNCGCCWAFGTTGLLEGAYFKKSGKLVSLSEQQLVECSPLFPGCDGGVAAYAIEYISSTGGLASEATYPYTSQLESYGACKIPSVPLVAMAPTYADIPQDDTALMTALATSGPISVSVAVGDLFMSYVSGIMDPTTACEAETNHAVLLTGYGTDTKTGKPYWLVKNSWSTDWGENGYFRLRRDVKDSCGINEDSISVTL